MLRNRWLVVALAFAVCCFKPQLACALELELGEQSFTVSGFKSGSSIVVFQVARLPLEHIGRITSSRQVLVDVEQEGVLTEELAEPIPWRSIWAAVDLGSGEVALAAPEGFPLRVLDPERSDLGAVMGGGTEGIDLVLGPGEFYELLLVRPEVGAWGVAVFDGNPDDADGAMTMAVAVPPAAFEGVASPEEAGPENLQTGDRIVGIDVNEMTVYTVQVSQLLGGEIR